MPDKSATLEIIERASKIFKEILILVVMAYLVWIVIPVAKKWLVGLDTTRVTEFTAPGFGVKLGPAPGPGSKSTVSQPSTGGTASTTPTNPPENTTTSATPTKPKEDKVRKVMTTPSPTWVFLGTANGSSLPSKTFKLMKLPVPGQEIEAAALVNTRITAPFSKDRKNWYFGRVVGFLKEGEHVSVRRLTTIKMSEDEPEYIWAEVEVISKPAQ